MNILKNLKKIIDKYDYIKLLEDQLFDILHCKNINNIKEISKYLEENYEKNLYSFLYKKKTDGEYVDLRICESRIMELKCMTYIDAKHTKELEELEEIKKELTLDKNALYDLSFELSLKSTELKQLVESCVRKLINESSNNSLKIKDLPLKVRIKLKKTKKIIDKNYTLNILKLKSWLNDKNQIKLKRSKKMYKKVSYCVHCPECVPYCEYKTPAKVLCCDRCGLYKGDLYESSDGEILCEKCYHKEVPKYSGSIYECEYCGCETDFLYNFQGEIICEDCLAEEYKLVS